MKKTRSYLKGPLSDHQTQELPGLREAPLPLLDFEKCQKLGKNYKEKLQVKSHLCAGDPVTGKRDACRVRKKIIKIHNDVLFLHNLILEEDNLLKK